MPPKPACECGECSTCKTREYNRRWRAENPERSRELRIASYYRHAEKRRAYSSSYYQEHREKILDYYSQKPSKKYKNPPEKTRAQNIVNRAIAKGELFPKACENCGAHAYPTRDGRRGVHAHHDDYNKPLEVRWLCYACHGKEHRRYE